MKQHEQKLNEFLVNVFNDILRLEEDSLAKGEHKNLSVSEMHVIEAVFACEQQGNAGMADVAARLAVTASTLTVAVKTLEQKGYLLRTRKEKDKRRVSVNVTEKAQSALNQHSAFHEALVKSAASSLSDEQLKALSQALGSLHEFFKGYK